MKFGSSKTSFQSGKAPTFSNKSNPLELLMARQMMKDQEDEQLSNQAIQQGGSLKEIKANGQTFEMPGARTATADAQNQLTRIKQLRGVTKNIESLAFSLPTDARVVGQYAGAKMAGGRFGTQATKTYLDSIPAASAGVYRAITGDNRLSDQDAASRAKPLFWHPLEGGDTREGKFAFLNYMMDEAERNITPGEPQGDLESMVRWQNFVDKAKKQFQVGGINKSDNAQLPQSDNGQTSQGGINIEQERQEAIKRIESGKYDAKKVADIFKSRTGKDLNG